MKKIKIIKSKKNRKAAYQRLKNMFAGTKKNIIYLRKVLNVLGNDWSWVEV